MLFNLLRSSTTAYRPHIHLNLRTLSSSTSSLPDFKNTKTSYSGLSTLQIFRGWVVLKICSFSPIVNNAEMLLSTSRRVFGDSFIKTLVEPTFFAHFCAGEGEDSIKPTVKWLNDNGVGAILDYAAEADMEEEAARNEEEEKKTATVTGKEYPSARVYEYKDEMYCDANAEIFYSAVHAVKNVTPEGFAAIKITALGNPQLLERMSSSLVEIRALFHRMDSDGSGLLTYDEFKKSWSDFFIVDEESEIYMKDMFQKFDKSGDGTIDSIEWTTHLKASDTQFLASKCLHQGPFAQAALDAEEVGLVNKMMERCASIVQLAEDLDVKVMFDAEHSYFQPAIHNIVLDLQREYNTGSSARVYNTFQMYLNSSERELERSILLSEREGWHFACKLVRGAYMVLERQRAVDMNYDSPIHETLEDTHNCYDNGVETVLGRKDVLDGTSKANLLIASHNEESIHKAISSMKNRNIDRKTGGVAFGQLLGMADFISFSLGNAGFQAYKYLPYGPFYEVLPYLVRRAQENSGLLSGGAKERKLMASELMRRVKPF